MKYLVLCLLSLNVIAAPSPHTEEQMENNAYRTYRVQKSGFNKERMGVRVQKALNTQVKYAESILTKKKIAYGQVALREWEMKYSKAFLNMEIGTMDIGDHEAIDWLLNFYSKLEGYLGIELMQSSHLHDIWVLAYAIPVVFEPSRTDIEKPEYKLHFVPFSKAVGFWLVIGGCTAYNFIGKPVTALICDPIAEAGRAAFGLIGDSLSDAIWNGAH